ncbi:hypothetical protein PG997_012936 [Apiospora hydei]|uniref:Rhodopsin domain-containing protein n=1 Tax=Apiospora hydei TaxID=1337664 RepID=A0ABR1V4R4_9PEZI
MPPGPVGAIPPPPGVTPNFENPEDILNTINLASQILSIVIMTIFLALRVYVKAKVAPPFLLDDWACCIAWVRVLSRLCFSCAPYLSLTWNGLTTVVQLLGPRRGIQHDSRNDGTLRGGYHAWDLTVQDYEGFLKARPITSASFALLLVIARVFGSFRATRISAWVIIILMLCYYIPVFIIKVQVCRPINAYWDLSIKGVDLVSQRALFVADTVMSTVSDTAVLILPIPATVSLRMQIGQKLKIWSMLGLGGLATMASIVRMVIVVKLQSSNDQSVEFVRFNLLGTAEVTIGVVCACLPALNILVARHRISSRESSEQSQSKFVEVMRSIKFLAGSKLQTAPPITPLRVTNMTRNNNNNNPNVNDNDMELR